MLDVVVLAVLVLLFLVFLALWVLVVAVLLVLVFWAKATVLDRTDRPRAAIMIFFIDIS